MSETTKPHIILDIDETLIHAYDKDKLVKKLDSKDKHIEKTIDKLKYHDMDGVYIIFERPHLQEFLDYVFENFNVSIWTAATKDYALFIINNCILTKPERKLNYFFYRYHSDLTDDLNIGYKNLSVLWKLFNLDEFNHKNCLIVDDNPDVKRANPDNIVVAEPFKIKNQNCLEDCDLIKCRKRIEERLSARNLKKQ